jgi:hypothetical protein
MGGKLDGVWSWMGMSTYAEDSSLPLEQPNSNVSIKNETRIDFMTGVFSPDGNGKPTAAKGCFCYRKTATNGSPFYGLQKRLLQRGLAMYSRIGF